MMRPIPLNDEVRAVMQSKMLAKFTILGKEIEIVALFEKSTYFSCFYVFTAKKPNAAMSEWQYTGKHSIYSGDFYTMDSFTAQQINFHFAGQIVSVDRKVYVSWEALAEFLDRTSHPYQYAKKVIPAGATFDHCNGSKRKPWFSNRNRAFDSMPVAKGEVLVYDDFCADCGKRHSIAHYPDGKTRCMGYAELKDHPALTYVGHQNNMFRFTYKVQEVS